MVKRLKKRYAPQAGTSHVCIAVIEDFYPINMTKNVHIHILQNIWRQAGKGETKMISVSNHDAIVLTYIARHPDIDDSERKELVAKLQSPAKELAARLKQAKKLTDAGCKE